MARKIKFALKMKDGVEVRNLQELKDNFDLNQVMGYLADGKLETWLADRYYDELADNVSMLDMRAPNLREKLCRIFGVEYEAEDALSMEEIEARNRKIEKLRQFTEDEEIIKNVDSVAFSQEELADILDDGKTTVYLCGQDFVIPKRQKGITYIGIQTELDLSLAEIEEYVKNDIKFVNLLKSWEADKEEGMQELPEDDKDTLVLLCWSKEEQHDILLRLGNKIEDYKNDDDDNALGIQYHIPLIRIPNPDILEYSHAVRYNGKQILYKAEDGQGSLVGVMNLDGSNNRVLRRWDEYDYPSEGIYAYKNYFLIGLESDYKHYVYERILVNGESTIVTLKDSYPNSVETSTGIYQIHYGVGRFSISEFLHGNDYDKEYEIRIADSYSDDLYDYSSMGTAVEEDKIYIFVGSRDKTGFFYVFDTATKKVKKASKIEIGYYEGPFCVTGDQIIYFGSDRWAEVHLMSLNMKTGRKKKIIDLSECSLRAEAMQVVGEYVYILPQRERCCYRMRPDGTERTMIGRKDTSLFGAFVKMNNEILKLTTGLKKVFEEKEDMDEKMDKEESAEEDLIYKEMQSITQIC